MASYNHEGVIEGVAMLVASGRALYGERWHTPLARDLGTTYRTVRNWMDGRHSPPADLDQRLHQLLVERRKQLSDVLARIDYNDEESRK